MTTMTRALLASALMAGCAMPAAAQTAETQAVAAPAAATQTAQVMLQRGTEVKLRLMQALNSKHTKSGERFNLEVAEPVTVGGRTVIPVGTRAVGEVTNVVKKGAFGKSGKIDTQLTYVMIGDRQVRLDGRGHQAGAGGTAATVGVAIAAGVFSAFVTGKSADLPVGAPMNGFVAEDVPVMVTGPAPAPVAVTAR